MRRIDLSTTYYLQQLHAVRTSFSLYRAAVVIPIAIAISIAIVVPIAISIAAVIWLRSLHIL